MILNKHVKCFSRVFFLMLLLSTVFILYSTIMKSFFFAKTNGKQISERHNISRTKRPIMFERNNRKIEIYDGESYSFGSLKAEIKLAVVLCGERLNQTIVTLKSAVIFSKHALHFVLIVDDKNKEKLKNELLDWPDSILDRLSFEIHPISFPSGNEGKEWIKLFKLCACQRLFFPSLLHHIDALLYVDTDVLFMQPIEDLWQYFHSMNESQIAALCPEHEDFATGWYNRFARHPYYEPLGVNSGVMLMNLTRMRAFQWESYFQPIMKEYKLHIVWGDQDVINIIFHFHPDKLFIFPCEWNFRPDHCMYSSVCKTAELNGIAAIHGSRNVFTNNKQPAFRAVYEVLEKHKISDDKLTLLELITNELAIAANTNCGKYLLKIFSSFKEHMYSLEKHNHR